MSIRSTWLKPVVSSRSHGGATPPVGRWLLRSGCPKRGARVCLCLISTSSKARSPFGDSCSAQPGRTAARECIHRRTGKPNRGVDCPAHRRRTSDIRAEVRQSGSRRSRPARMSFGSEVRTILLRLNRRARGRPTLSRRIGAVATAGYQAYLIHPPSAGAAPQQLPAFQGCPRQGLNLRPTA